VKPALHSSFLFTHNHKKMKVQLSNLTKKRRQILRRDFVEVLTTPSRRV